MILGLLIVCFMIDRAPSPEEWIDGHWVGPLDVVQLRPSPGPHVTATVAVPVETTDSFLKRHGGHGTIRFPGDPKAYVFKLFGLELEQDVMKSDRPLVRAGPHGYVLKGEGDIDGKPPELEQLYTSLSSLGGRVEPGAIHLRNGDCGAPAPLHCTDDYAVTIDLKPVPPAKATQALETAWRFAMPFVWFLPMFVIFHRRRYRPWSGVYLVTVLTLVAGLTFGVSWLIALAMAVGLITPKVRGGASR